VAIKSLLFEKAKSATEIATPKVKTANIIFPGIGYMIDV